MESYYIEPIITVAFVDDHTAIMHYVSSHLQAHHPSIEVMFIARDGQEMKDHIERLGPPQVVVMDVQMPGIDGYAATEWLCRHHPGTHIIAYSAFVNTDTVNDMLHRGARGILAKGSDSDSLAEAILGITAKGHYLNEYVTEQMLKSLVRGWLPEGIGKIPKRRRQVIECCHEGLTNKEIATRMNISVNAVGEHFRDLFDQFGVKDRVSLISKAMACGLLPPKRS